METVILKNGAEEVKALVNVTMFSLERLGPIEFYELVQTCRVRGHVPFGNTQSTLQSLGLLERNGVPYDSIRNIVLSAAVGEGLELRLQSPIKEV